MLWLVLIASILVLSACDDPQTTGANDPNVESTAVAPPPADATPVEGADAGGSGLTVVVNEWSVQPEGQVVVPGAVDFEISNLGQVDHTFVVIRTELPADELPVVEATVDLEQLDAVASSGLFSPGGVQHVDVDLSAGSYVLICNLPSHYQAGMRSALVAR